MTRTKTIDITNWAEDFPGVSDLTLKIKIMTYGEFSQMTEQMIQMKVIGSQNITTTSIERSQILSLLYGIKEAPFPITEEGIKDLPSDLGMYLYDEIESFNSRDRGKNLRG